jgi:hypothetical protein
MTGSGTSDGDEPEHASARSRGWREVAEDRDGRLDERVLIGEVAAADARIQLVSGDIQDEAMFLLALPSAISQSARSACFSS